LAHGTGELLAVHVARHPQGNHHIYTYTSVLFCDDDIALPNSEEQIMENGCKNGHNFSPIYILVTDIVAYLMG
jgi:hypothetical protein